MSDALVPIEVFCSYAHEDESLLREMKAHLSGLQRQSRISTWYDRQIIAGTNWAQVIDTHLETASLLLLLVSADFLASDYCYEIEMQRAIQRYEANEAQVIPIIVRPCDWNYTPFARLQCLPRNGKPVTMWLNTDEAWMDVVTGIRQAVKDVSSGKQDAEVKSSQQIADEHGKTSISRTPAELNDNAVRHTCSQSKRFGAPFPQVWNVFRRHTPFFTGRDHVLQRLSDGFRSEEQVEIVPPQAITGLGGMGKTQTAAEYAYRFRGDYRAVLWVRAETQEDLVMDFKTIAGLLQRPQEHLQDRASLVQTMKEWFTTQADWLLIFDNADNPALVDAFLPRAARGHLLLTTRAGATVEQAQPLRLEPLGPEDGALCILRRAGILAWNKPLHDVPSAIVNAARQLSQLMDGLPLALEQAGAYINDTECGIRRYLHLYQQYRSEIQHLRYGTVPDYPESVASAWRIARSMVEQSNPAASELLRLCAYLAPEAIPDELVTKGASALGPVLGPVAANPVALDRTIGLLRKYSLLNREADREMDLTRLSIHRVMQEILLDEMDKPTQQLWAERAVRAVAQALPTMMWQILQAHARNCVHLIEQWNMTFPEAKLVQRRVEEAHHAENR